jgi:hypothetical protein
VATHYRVEQPTKKIKLDNNKKFKRKGRMIRSIEKEKQAGKKPQLVSSQQ